MIDPEQVRRMQEVSAAYAEGEVELPLGDRPRLFRLPKCTQAGLTHNAGRLGLLLDTEIGEHRFLMELDWRVAEALHDLLGHALKDVEGG